MSLIEEALRKQREENDQTQAPEPTKLSMMPAATPPPPVPPPAPAEEETSTTRRAWPLLAGIFGIGLVLVGAIILLLFFGVKVWRAKPAGKPAPVAARATPAASKATPAPATSPAQPVTRTTAAAVLPPADTNPAPIVAAPVTTTPAPAAPVAAVPVAAPPEVAATGSVPVTTPAAPAPEPVPAPAAPEPGVVKIDGTSAPASTGEKKSLVPWPRLAVTGLIGTSQGSKGAAIINGQLLGPGNTIEGVKIIAVDRQGVRLSFGGEVRTLTAGSTTE